MATQKLAPEEFLVPPHGADGRGVRICFRIPPLMDRALDELVRSGKFPFRTRDDACRWSLYNGLKSLESMGHFSSALRVLDIMVLLLRLRWPFEICDEFFEKLDRLVLDLVTSGFQEKRARKLVKAIEELILCMPSSRDRGWYLGELRRRWSHLLTLPAE